MANYIREWWNARGMHAYAESVRTGSAQAYQSNTQRTTESFRTVNITSMSSSSSTSHSYNGGAFPSTTVKEVDPVEAIYRSPNKKQTLRLARERYLDHSYITTGVLPYPGFATDEEQASGHQSSVAAECTEVSVRLPRGSEPSFGTPHARCPIDTKLYATTINMQTEEWKSVEVMEDSGSDFNWIPQGIVNRLELHTSPANTSVVDFQGNEYRVTQLVKLSLGGKGNKSKRIGCYVAPESFPLQGAVVVGKPFLRDHGPVRNFCYEIEPPGVALLVMQSKLTKGERQAIEVQRAQIEAIAHNLEQKRRLKAQKKEQEGPSSSKTEAISKKDW